MSPHDLESLLRELSRRESRDCDTLATTDQQADAETIGDRDYQQWTKQMRGYEQ